MFVYLYFQGVAEADEEFFRLNELHSLLCFVSDSQFNGAKRYQTITKRQQEVLGITLLHYRVLCYACSNFILLYYFVHMYNFSYRMWSPKV